MCSTGDNIQKALTVEKRIIKKITKKKLKGKKKSHIPSILTSNDKESQRVLKKSASYLKMLSLGSYHSNVSSSSDVLHSNRRILNC